MSAYLYTNAVPHSTVYSHFKLLNELKSNSFSDLVTICCSQMKKTHKIHHVAILLAISAAASNSIVVLKPLHRNFAKSDTEKMALFESIAMRNGAEVKRIQTACHALDSVLNAMVEKSLSTPHITQDLTNLGLLADKTDIVAKCCSSLIGSAEENLSPIDHISTNQLVDMEWKFGVTAASSELDKVGSTFLQLQLKVSNQSGALESINMELTLSQFYNFLHELEKAKTGLEHM